MGISKRRAKDVTGIDIDIGEANYVTKKEILPKLIDKYLLHSNMKSEMKIKMEGFMKGEKTWDTPEEYHDMLMYKRKLLIDQSSKNGLYDNVKDEVYIITDTLEEWEDYFKSDSSDWKKEIDRCADLVELHEFTHKTHFTRCPEFNTYYENIKKRKRKLQQDYKKMVIEAGKKAKSDFIKKMGNDPKIREAGKGKKIELNVKFEVPKRIKQGIKKANDELLACKILSEGLAYWVTRKFYTNDPEYEKAGSAYEASRFRSNKNQVSKYLTYIDVIDEMYKRHGEAMIEKLNTKLSYTDAVNIIRKAKSYENKRKLSNS